MIKYLGGPQRFSLDSFDDDFFITHDSTLEIDSKDYYLYHLTNPTNRRIMELVLDGKIFPEISLILGQPEQIIRNLFEKTRKEFVGR